MTGPIEVAAFEAANSRRYLEAVFAAWEAGETVMALPEGAAGRTVPGTAVLRRESFPADPGWFEAALPERAGDERALIAFSSGTTGRPKAILLGHGALSDVVGRINAAMGVDGTIREYLGVPVTFSFGFGRARAVAAAGGRAFLPEHGFDPSEIGRMLASGEINAVSAVPTLWRILLANKDTIPAESARKLRWIEIGSQWMTGAEKLELRQLFPEAKIVQHYGLTEASRTALLDISEAPAERLDSVGRAEGAVEIAVGEDGHIRTRGPHVALGLVSGAGVKPVTDAEGWLVTTDTGRMDDGWLFYTGRSDELINTGGIKIDPTAFEQAVGAALGQPGAVAAGRVADALRGEKVLLAYAGDLDRDRLAKAAGEVAEGLGLTARGTFELRRVAEIPLTATGKVRRAALADLPEIATPAAAPAPVAAAPAKDRAAELQALWGEILGRDTVPTDKSFYDLGGDSLSALTAILRMEAMGIDADTARGIFEGKSIDEMVGAPSGAAPPPAAAPAPAAAPIPANVITPAPAASGRAADLQALWAEILGRDKVPTDKSFYDLGGDSLSALTAILRMEAMGIDADTARGIFEGKSIDEIAGPGGTGPEPAPASPAPSPAPSPAVAAAATLGGARLSLAESINAVHAARGVLILWVVLVNWAPGILNRLGDDLLWLNEAMTPFWRFGTPGFAFVFGIGIGALGIHHYRTNPEMFRKSMRFNTRLIVGGVLFLALIKLAIALRAGLIGDRIAMSGLFYSVITYYALAMLAMPFIVRVVASARHTLLAIFALAAGSMIVHEVLSALIAGTSPPAVLEFVKLTLVAKYGFFRMTGYVLIGVAMGYLFRRHHGEPGAAGAFAGTGATMVAFGFLALYQSAPADIGASFGPPELWHISVYAGVTLLILSGFCVLNVGGQPGGVVGLFNAFAIASGILALPIFLGDELLLALKALADSFGIPELLSFAVLLALFFGGLGVAYRRLMPFFLRASGPRPEPVTTTG